MSTHKLAIITPGGITNFGERAIMLGTVYRLRQEHPKDEIAIFGYQNLATEDPRLYAELMRQGVSFYPLIIQGKSRAAKVRRIIGLYLAPKLVLPKASYDYLKQATVYSKGQESFTQAYGLVHFVDSFLEQFLVSRITPEVIMLGHSIGPIKKYKWLASYAVKKLAKIYVRDSRSRQVLLDIGYSPDKIEQTKDLAYRAVAGYNLGEEVKSKDHYLIVPNAAICLTAEQTERYMTNLKSVIEALLKKGEHVIIGSSVLDKGWNNDYALCERLKADYAELKLKYYSHLHEFLLDVRGAKKVISSRLHPLIMATGLDTDVFALSNSHKVKGLLGDLGLELAISDPYEPIGETELDKQL